MAGDERRRLRNRSISQKERKDDGRCDVMDHLALGGKQEENLFAVGKLFQKENRENVHGTVTPLGKLVFFSGWDLHEHASIQCLKVRTSALVIAAGLAGLAASGTALGYHRPIRASEWGSFYGPVWLRIAERIALELRVRLGILRCAYCTVLRL